MGIEPDSDGLVIVSRKITPSRSISRVNDETVTAARLSQITGLLLDIHGQHEHQSLLHKSKHLEILDAYARSLTQPLKAQIAEQEYQRYRALHGNAGRNFPWTGRRESARRISCASRSRRLRRLRLRRARRRSWPRGTAVWQMPGRSRKAWDGPMRCPAVGGAVRGGEGCGGGGPV